jgi:hypothetical protein
MFSEGQGAKGSFAYELNTKMETSASSTSLSLSGSIELLGGKNGYLAVASVDILINGKPINDPGLNLKSLDQNITQMGDADKIFLGSIDLFNIPVTGRLEVVFKITTVHEDGGSRGASNSEIKVKLR